MFKKISLPFLFYLCFYSHFILGQVFDFLSPASNVRLYFQICYSFDPIYYLHYTAYMIQLAINCFQIFLLSCNLLRVKVFNSLFWKTVLFSRLFFDLAGHDYYRQELIGIFNDNVLTACLVLGYYVVIVLPSYGVGILYAFTFKDLFKEKSNPSPS